MSEIKRYKIKCIVETYDKTELFIEWMKKMGFHSIKITEIDE